MEIPRWRWRGNVCGEPYLIGPERQTGHPCKISLSIHASDEGALISTPLHPPASPFSLFQTRGVLPKRLTTPVPQECSCRTLKEKTDDLTNVPLGTHTASY